MSAIDVDRFRQTLLEERGRVTAAIQNLHDESPGTLEEASGEMTSVDNHPGDVATETFDRELDQTLEDNERNLLAQIDAALARIDEGTFGTCQRCGREIAPARLEARPWSRLCIDCAREAGRG